jgi:hypothetical protein
MPAAPPPRLADLAIARRLRAIYDQHDRLALLCAELEAIADDLPRACPQRCRRAAEALGSLVPAHHADEIGLLRALLATDRPDLLDRIERQHGEDDGLAGEIGHGLEPIVAGGAAEAPETLGYMLRCFFTGYRRAMLVEELAIRVAAGGAPVA